MKFVPKYNFQVLNEEEYPFAIKKIEEDLSKYQNSGYFDTFDGKKNYYEYFLCENSKASIVIVHGLSEFTKKFYEIAFYLLNMGYNVFLFDQRCHGLSCRLTDRVDMIHVDKFEDYAADLSLFIDNVVIPADDKPLYLYSISMGGAVSLLYLANEQTKIKKAVLAAPLIDPKDTMVPRLIAKAGIIFWTALHGSKSKFKFSKEFNPEVPYRSELDSSRCRFERNMELRREEVMYQSTPLSLGWTYNSVSIRPKLLRRSFIKKIKTPLLLISSGKDMVVKNDAHEIFARRCDYCDRIIIDGATHSVLSSKSSIIKEHLSACLEFYDS